MGGRASRGWVHVDPAVLEGEVELREWLDIGVAAARSAAPRA